MMHQTFGELLSLIFMYPETNDMQIHILCLYNRMSSGLVQPKHIQPYNLQWDAECSGHFSRVGPEHNQLYSLHNHSMTLSLFTSPLPVSVFIGFMSSSTARVSFTSPFLSFSTISVS
mmetsp:Transcript_25675/g.43024  ORF Transcript_25675/g.43024 Transcript_25675/m.43024 type:complete len:117 (+) Transcript_25675:37-387(+)